MNLMSQDSLNSPRPRRLFPLLRTLQVSLLAGVFLALGLCNSTAHGFDGDRSYGYLKTLCDLGNRKSGSPGMEQQQQLLEKHFQALGAQVSFQEFEDRDPLDGKRVPMANMIVEWHPSAKRRLLLCAHYDTRPYPDREPNPRDRGGVFVGANDGASGVALLMELGHHMASLPETYGIDFVFFDGEELVYFDGRRDIGTYFLGSIHFAQQYVKQPPEHEYVGGVLFDMVADKRLTLYQERYSVSFAKARPLVQEIWGTAQKLGVKEFIPRVKFEVRDDHLPLNQIGRIPVCDVIDFEYPNSRHGYWHRLADNPDNCSAESLGKVGAVVVEWLTTKQ